jgi:hypothetical protein
MITSLSFLKISFIVSQIAYRMLFRPVTEAMDLEIWDACLYPGGYR